MWKDRAVVSCPCLVPVRLCGFRQLRHPTSRMCQSGRNEPETISSSLHKVNVFRVASADAKGTGLSGRRVRERSRHSIISEVYPTL